MASCDKQVKCWDLASNQAIQVHIAYKKKIGTYVIKKFVTSLGIALNKSPQNNVMIIFSNFPFLNNTYYVSGC